MPYIMQKYEVNGAYITIAWYINKAYITKLFQTLYSKGHIVTYRFMLFIEKKWLLWSRFW